MKRKTKIITLIAVLMIIFVFSITLLTACNIYNPMNDDEFMSKLLGTEMLLSGQLYSGQSQFPFGQGSGYEGWYADSPKKKAGKFSFQLHIPNRYQVFGDSGLISAQEISDQMQPIEVTLKKDSIIVSSRAEETFSIDGKQFKHYTWKDNILRNSILNNEPIPNMVFNDDVELKNWIIEHLSAPSDVEINKTEKVELVCSFTKGLSRDELRKFLYDQDNIYNVKSLIKTGTEPQDILLQNYLGYIASSIESQLKTLASEEYRDAINLIARSALFDLPSFSIEEIYQYVLNNPPCIVGLVCDVKLSDINELLNSTALQDDNKINIIDMKYIY